jgi:hypothetical protein
LVVGSNHGWDYLALFFQDVMAMTWQGQFNSDFIGFLTLTGVWLAWRHHFSPAGLLLGVCGFFGGVLFLCGYLLVASYQAEGDINVLLLGKQRA